MNTAGHIQLQSLFGLSLFGNYHYYHALKAAEAASQMTGLYFGGTILTTALMAFLNMNAYVTKNSLIWEIHLLPSRDTVQIKLG